MNGCVKWIPPLYFIDSGLERLHPHTFDWKILNKRSRVVKTGNNWLWKIRIVIAALAMTGLIAQAGVISAGYYDSFGVKADNSLWGWGYDGGIYYLDLITQTVAVAKAQLGLGPTNSMANGAYVASPTQSGTAKTWLDVVGIECRGFGIQSDGSLWGWGYDGVPVATSLGMKYVIINHYEQNGALGMGAQLCQVIAGVYTNISVTINTFGIFRLVQTTTRIYTDSVMNGLTTNRPTQLGINTNWRQVAAGSTFGLGLQADGSIWSWGADGESKTYTYNTNGFTAITECQGLGQLGQGDRVVTSTNYGGGDSYCQITQTYTNDAATNYYLVSTTTNIITNAVTTNFVQYALALNTPTKITAPTSMVYVTAGYAHSAAIGSDGSLWTWGKNEGGFYAVSVSVTNYIPPWNTNYYYHALVPSFNTHRSILGLGDTTLFATNVPTRVGSETTWASVSAGLNSDFTLAIRTDGSLWGWGNNGYAGAVYSWSGTAATAYYDHTATATNTYSFSIFAYGYLGLGSNVPNAATPTRVGTDNNWAMVSAGNQHALGLKSDGSLYTWGYNGSGRLGIGRTDFYVAVPTRVGADNDWVAISAGYDHSLALKSDGSLWAWGANIFAQLGDQFGSAYEPVKISSGWGYSSPVIAATENGGGDYDGDGKTDFVMYDAATGNWLVRLSTMSYSLYSLDAMLGGPGYALVTADFDGDRKTDPAVYQESTGTWLIKLSDSGYALVTLAGWLGGSGYTAVPTDYDGDGKADPAVYQASTGEWRIRMSGSGYATLLKTLGAGCLPVPKDFDGDRLADLAVYELATGNWQVMLSGSEDAVVPVASFGGNGWLAIPMDVDGDGKTDAAVYQSSTGVWKIMLSAMGYFVYDSSVYGWTLGGTGYIPTPADYDGDGKVDPAVYSHTSGQWTIKLSAYDYYTYMTIW